MRRVLVLALAVMTLMWNAGCIMVIGVRGHRDPDLIEVNGEMYRVDEETGRAQKVDCAPEKREEEKGEEGKG